jgi:GNAT superfamily N-acetyltransferase
VAPAARGPGAARALIEAVYAEADRRGADRTYWETQEFNGPARSLYDVMAHRTSFIIYER